MNRRGFYKNLFGSVAALAIGNKVPLAASKTTELVCGSFGPSIDNELTRIMAQEIQKEIDREILLRITKISGGRGIKSPPNNS